MQNDKIDIKSILKGCAKQECKAQRKLYNLFADKMFALCLYYAGNRQDAEDILQEGFVKVYQNIKQYNNKGSLEGWIRKVFINTALSFFRKNNGIFTIDKTELIKDNHTIEEKIEANDLMKMIMELSPQYRIVFNLYAIEGYSHAEIGKMLDISENTSKSNLSRARKILQKKVAHFNK